MPTSSSQEMVAFLVRAEPGESYTGQGCRIHRSKQPCWGWRKDVLQTSRKIRGGNPLIWEWFTSEDKQIYQNLSTTSHAAAKQCQASTNPAGSLHYCKPT